MKRTKANFKTHQTYRIIDEIRCVPFVWNENDNLNMDGKNDVTLNSGLIYVYWGPKKYNTGHGKTGDMVVFKVNGGGDYAVFWSDFKKSTVFIPDSMALDISDNELNVGDTVCYARSAGLGTPYLEIETITAIEKHEARRIDNFSTRPEHVIVKMGRKHIDDPRTRLKKL